MGRNRIRWLLMLLLGLLLLTTVTYAQTGGGFDLTWSTVDNGGGVSATGGYELVGTIGQPDAGLISSGGYNLSAGFWDAAGVQRPVYLPAIYRRGW